jgi:hypothetical protein
MAFVGLKDVKNSPVKGVGLFIIITILTTQVHQKLADSRFRARNWEFTMKSSQFIIASIGLLFSLTASASAPVAIVEDVQSNKAGVGIMDFLVSGQTIELGKDEQMTIGYLNSCRRERIKGGKITIGTDQSQVSNGQVMREDVECDGGSANLSGQQAAKSGALAFRSAPSGVGLNSPKVTVYGTSPMIVLPSAGLHIVIESVSGNPDRHEVSVQGSYVDLNDHNISLAPNTVYRVEAGDKSMTFKIDIDAEPGKTPIISRLVRVQ